MPERPSARRKEFIRRELDACERGYRAGNLVSVVTALDWRHRWNEPLPKWLIAALDSTYPKLLRSDRPDQRGRTANSLARYKADMRHYARWDAVVYIRERQQERREERDALLKDGLSEEEVDAVFANDRDPGKTWEDAYEKAAEDLKGTPAYCSPSTVKNSYRIVQRIFREGGVEPGRFRVSSASVLRRLRIDDYIL